MYTKSIVDTKLLFIGVAPDASTHASVFTKDWSLAMTVLDQIQKMAETPHFKDKQGFMMIPVRSLNSNTVSSKSVSFHRLSTID